MPLSTAARDNKFELVADIEVNPAKFATEMNYSSTQFYLRNKKSVGKYNSFEIKDIINKYAGAPDRRDIFIIAESPADTIVFSGAETDPAITIIPPVLIFDELTGSIGDTVKVYDVKGKPKGTVDLDAVGREFGEAIMRRIFLQLESIPKPEKERIFGKISIIFPQDKSTSRWIENVTRLKVYKLKD